MRFLIHHKSNKGKSQLGALFAKVMVIALVGCVDARARELWLGGCFGAIAMAARGVWFKGIARWGFCSLGPRPYSDICWSRGALSSMVLRSFLICLAQLVHRCARNRVAKWWNTRAAPQQQSTRRRPWPAALRYGRARSRENVRMVCARFPARKCGGCGA